jgi:hypothetical protein
MRASAGGPLDWSGDPDAWLVRELRSINEPSGRHWLTVRLRVFVVDDELCRPRAFLACVWVSVCANGVDYSARNSGIDSPT